MRRAFPVPSRGCCWRPAAARSDLPFEKAATNAGGACHVDRHSPLPVSRARHGHDASAPRAGSGDLLEDDLSRELRSDHFPVLAPVLVTLHLDLVGAYRSLTQRIGLLFVGLDRRQ